MLTNRKKKRYRIWFIQVLFCKFEYVMQIKEKAQKGMNKNKTEQ